jgi:hypothetical protein
MGLKRNSLVDTVLSRLSLDEFEPKTGDLKEVIVLGFRVVDQAPGEDLYNYFNNGYIEARDVEVSPNPDPDGHFLVFLELDREPGVLDTIRDLVRDVENVSGKLNWKVRTHVSGDYFPLFGDEIEQYVFQSADEYLSKDEYQEKGTDDIYEFFRISSLEHLRLAENRITLSKGSTSATLEIMGFGPADKIMKGLGIAESALVPQDRTFRIFNTMLGDLNAVALDKYIVIYHPTSTDILVGRPC